MRHRILTAMLAVTALAVTLLGLPLAVLVRADERRVETIDLERRAAAAGLRLSADALQGGRDPVELPAPAAPRRLAVYLPDGTLLAGDGPVSADPATRAALGGRVTDTADGRELAVAIPVPDGETVVAAVRASIPLAAVDGHAWRIWAMIAGLATAVLLIAAAIAAAAANRLSRPVAALAAAAARLGDGDFTARAAGGGISDLEVAAGALNRTAQRLGELVARERAFSADASHQLRSALARLRLGLESALLDPAADRTAAVKGAVGDVDRMQATLDQLLDLARDTHDRAPLAVRALLDEVETDWRGPLAATGRPLRVAAADRLPDVRVSAAAVRQILDVLVANALQHGAGPVTLRAVELPGGMLLEVCDEGEGLRDPAAAFRRRDPGSGGHGIGLALARSLAVAEGGRLHLRAAGPDPCFQLFLPAATPGSTSLAKALGPDSAAGGQVV